MVWYWYEYDWTCCYSLKDHVLNSIFCKIPRFNFKSACVNSWANDNIYVFFRWFCRRNNLSILCRTIDIATSQRSIIKSLGDGSCVLFKWNVARMLLNDMHCRVEVELADGWVIISIDRLRWHLIRIIGNDGWIKCRLILLSTFLIKSSLKSSLLSTRQRL